MKFSIHLYSFIFSFEFFLIINNFELKFRPEMIIKRRILHFLEIVKDVNNLFYVSLQFLCELNNISHVKDSKRVTFDVKLVEKNIFKALTVKIFFF